MNSPSHLLGTIVALKRYRLACFVLATLLLFNPFLAAPRSGKGLQVSHPPSHRATVGASELQGFSPMDGWGSRPVVDVTATALPLPLPELSSRFFVFLHPIARLPQQFFGPGLWFRPPPVR